MRRGAALAVTVLLAVAGCGGDDDDAPATEERDGDNTEDAEGSSSALEDTTTTSPPAPGEAKTPTVLADAVPLPFDRLNPVVVTPVAGVQDEGMGAGSLLWVVDQDGGYVPIRMGVEDVPAAALPRVELDGAGTRLFSGTDLWSVTATRLVRIDDDIDGTVQLGPSFDVGANVVSVTSWQEGLYVLAGSRLTGEASQLLSLDPETGAVRASITVAGGARDLVFDPGATPAPDDDALVVATDGALTWHRVSDLEEIGSVELNASKLALNDYPGGGVFAVDESDVYYASVDGSQRIGRWNNEGGGYSGPSVVLAASGAVWVGAFDSVLIGVDLTGQRVEFPVTSDGYVPALEFGGGGLFVGVSDHNAGGSVQFIDLDVAP